MKTGVVKFYNKEKGFGFIVPDDRGKDIFFHVSGTTEELNEKDHIEYDEETGKRGIKAVNITKM